MSDPERTRAAAAGQLYAFASQSADACRAAASRFTASAAANQACAHLCPPLVDLLGAAPTETQLELEFAQYMAEQRASGEY